MIEAKEFPIAARYGMKKLVDYGFDKGFVVIDCFVYPDYEKTFASIIGGHA